MDEEAKARFEEMYLTYQDTLRRLAYAYDIPVDDIDDIIQDTSRQTHERSSGINSAFCYFLSF